MMLGAIILSDQYAVFTVCPVDDPKLLSNDGIDRIANKSKEISGVFSSINNITNVLIHLDESYLIDALDAIFFKTTMNCNDSAEICYFGCLYILFGPTVVPFSGDQKKNPEIVIIECIH